MGSGGWRIVEMNRAVNLGGGGKLGCMLVQSGVFDLSYFKL